MKKSVKIMAVILICAAVAVCFAACGANSASGISFSYNGSAVTDGVLEVDITAGTVDLKVTGAGNGDITNAVTLTSSNAAVATIAGKTATLVAAGRTVITATSADDPALSRSIVLSVTQAGGLPAITVGGATADHKTAGAGTLVKLTPDVPAGQEFLKWVTEPADLVITNNTFVMPATSVSIGAVYGYIPNAGLTVTAASTDLYKVDTVTEGKAFSVSYSNVDASGYSALGAEIGGAVAGKTRYAITFENTGNTAIDIRMDMKTAEGNLLNGLVSHGAPDGDFFTIGAGKTVTVINGLRTANPDAPSELYTAPVSLTMFIDSCRWEWGSGYVDTPILRTNKLIVSNLYFFD